MVNHTETLVWFIRLAFENTECFLFAEMVHRVSRTKFLKVKSIYKKRTIIPGWLLPNTETVDYSNQVILPKRPYITKLSTNGSGDVTFMSKQTDFLTSDAKEGERRLSSAPLTCVQPRIGTESANGSGILMQTWTWSVRGSVFVALLPRCNGKTRQGFLQGSQIWSVIGIFLWTLCETSACIWKTKHNVETRQSLK